MTQDEGTRTIRLSVGLICLGLIFILAIGIIGGFIGSRFTPAPITVLPNGDRTIVPVSQQVTISPSKTGEDITATQGKSILLLVTQTPKGISPLGTGIIMTSDGVIATASKLPDIVTPVFSLGEQGSLTAVTHIGTDALSGITFLKATDQILPPVTLAQTSPGVGAELIALSRREDTGSLAASRHTLSALVAPEESAAVGIQRVGILTTTAPLQVSTALFTDEGRLAGMISSQKTPSFLLVPDITAALSRLSTNALAENPFETRGFAVSWKFTPDITGAFGMRAIVQQVTPKSQASDVGVKVGDILVTANGSPITWDSDLTSEIAKHPLRLSILRQTEERTLSFP